MAQGSSLYAFLLQMNFLNMAVLLFYGIQLMHFDPGKRSDDHIGRKSLIYSKNKVIEKCRLTLFT